MRSITISLVLAGAMAASAFTAASCSSSSSPAPAGGDDSGTGSSSGGSSSGGSGSGSSGGPPPCVPYVSDAGLTSPTVSFKRDVLPLFERSCGLSSSCHYDPGPNTIAMLGIFLGCDITFDAGAGSVNNCSTADPGPIVYQDLVGTPDGGPALKPAEINNMPFVTPGDPTMSYIMHKIDGDTCTLTAGCVANNAPVASTQMNPPNSLGPGNPPNWCGQQMPLNNEPIPAIAVCGAPADCTNPSAFSSNTIRAWIAQGALNN
jgi:hypothetical protein